MLFYSPLFNNQQQQQQQAYVCQRFLISTTSDSNQIQKQFSLNLNFVFVCFHRVNSFFSLFICLLHLNCFIHQNPFPISYTSSSSSSLKSSILLCWQLFRIWQYVYRYRLQSTIIWKTTFIISTFARKLSQNHVTEYFRLCVVNLIPCTILSVCIFVFQSLIVGLPYTHPFDLLKYYYFHLFFVIHKSSILYLPFFTNYIFCCSFHE